MSIPKPHKRDWQPREMQMVQEYLTKFYSGHTIMTRVRLGPPFSTRPTEEMSQQEVAALSGWRRWADAIAILPDKLVLIEAAIRPELGDVSKLQGYKMLIPQTPELSKYKRLPIESVLLYAVEDPLTIYMSVKAGITCIQYQPPWLEAYLKILYPRERRGTPFTSPG